MLNLYLRERGDAQDQEQRRSDRELELPRRSEVAGSPKSRENVEKVTEYNMAERLLRRFSVQQMILQCMAEQKLDALVYPTSNLPPTKLGAPQGPPINGRNGGGVWSFLGAQGFPGDHGAGGLHDRSLRSDSRSERAANAGVRVGRAVAVVVAAGRSKATIARDSIGPIAAKLPVGMDIVGRPFDEPLIIRSPARTRLRRSTVRHRAISNR